MRKHVEQDVRRHHVLDELHQEVDQRQDDSVQDDQDQRQDDSVQDDPDRVQDDSIQDDQDRVQDDSVQYREADKCNVGRFQGTASFIYFASLYSRQNWHTRLDRLQPDGQINHWLDGSAKTVGRETYTHEIIYSRYFT